MSQKVKWFNFPITRHEKQLLRRHTFVRHLCYSALVVLPISSGYIHEIDFWLINSRVRVCRHDSHNSTRSTILRICQPSMTDSCLNHNNNNIVYVSPDWTVQKPFNGHLQIGYHRIGDQSIGETVTEQLRRDLGCRVFFISYQSSFMVIARKMLISCQFYLNCN